MTALIVGTLLALGALTYVLWPLIAAVERPSPPRPSPGPPLLMDDDAARSGPPRHIDLGDATSDDAAEAEIRRVRAQTRVCPVCGPRPEPAARYCSRCGRALA